MKRCLLFLLLAASAMAADTQNWPQFRGAAHDPIDGLHDLLLALLNTHEFTVNH